MERPKIFYTVVLESGQEKGRYSSKSGPITAAKKAASRSFGRNNNSSLRIKIRQLGTKKVYEYIANRIKLDKPLTRKIGDSIISHKWVINVVASKKQHGGGIFLPNTNNFYWQPTESPSEKGATVNVSGLSFNTESWEPAGTQRNLAGNQRELKGIHQNADNQVKLENIIYSIISGSKSHIKQQCVALAHALEARSEIDFTLSDDLQNKLKTINRSQIYSIISYVKSICINSLFICIKDPGLLLDLDSIYFGSDNIIQDGAGDFVSVFEPFDLIIRPIYLTFYSLLRLHDYITKQLINYKFIVKNTEKIEQLTCEDAVVFQKQYIYNGYLLKGTSWNYLHDTFDSKIIISDIRRHNVLSLEQLRACIGENNMEEYIEDYTIDVYIKPSKVIKQIHIKFDVKKYWNKIKKSESIMKYLKCAHHQVTSSDTYNLSIYFRSLLNICPQFFISTSDTDSCYDPITYLFLNEHNRLYIRSSEWKITTKSTILNMFRQYNRGTCWLCVIINVLYLLYIFDDTFQIKQNMIPVWNNLLHTLDIHSFAKHLRLNFMDVNLDIGSIFVTPYIHTYCNLKKAIKSVWDMSELLYKMIAGDDSKAYIVIYNTDNHVITFFLTKSYGYYIDSNHINIIDIEYPDDWKKCNNADELKNKIYENKEDIWYDILYSRRLLPIPNDYIELNIKPNFSLDDFKSSYLIGRNYYQHKTSSLPNIRPWRP